MYLSKEAIMIRRDGTTLAAPDAVAKTHDLIEIADTPSIAPIRELPAMELPAVTVIVLASKDGIRETMDSILAQDYQDVEYLVVDDGPRGSAAEIIDSYATAHPNKFAHNGCVMPNDRNSLNRAWRLVSGRYVAIVCSGDVPSPNWLSTCVSFMDANPQVIVGYPDWTLTDSKGNALADVRAPDFDFRRMLIETLCMPGPGALIRRHAVFLSALRARSFRIANGYETWLHLGLRGEFMRIPSRVVARPKYAGSESERFAEYLRAIDSLYAQTDLPAVMRYWRRTARANAGLIFAWTAARKRSWTAALGVLAAFPLAPRHAGRELAILILSRLIEAAPPHMLARVRHRLACALDRRRQALQIVGR